MKNIIKILLFLICSNTFAETLNYLENAQFLNGAQIYNSFTFNGTTEEYDLDKNGSFSVNPINGINGFYIKDKDLETVIETVIYNRINDWHVSPVDGKTYKLNAEFDYGPSIFYYEIGIETKNILDTIDYNTFINRNFTNAIIGTNVKKILSTQSEYGSLGSKLINISIPDSVISIDKSAFEDCPNELFDTETISGCKLVDGWVVSGETENLHSIRGVCNNAFYENDNIGNLVINGNNIKIGLSAFEYCSSLTNAILSNIEFIDTNSFNNCISLTNVTFTDKTVYEVLELQGFPFGLPAGSIIHCTDDDIEVYDWQYVEDTSTRDAINYIKITGASPQLHGRVYIPHYLYGNSVYSINDSSFKNCTTLEDLILSGNLKELKYESFYGCTGLKELVIPSNIETLGHSCFYNCTNITNVIFNTTNTLNIIDHVFHNCRGIKNMEFPEGVTAANPGVMAGCTGLTNLVLPDSLTAIEWEAFNGCSSLNSITFGRNIASTYRQYSSPFGGCPIKHIKFRGMFNIIDYMIYGASKTDVTDIEIDFDGDHSIRGYAFQGCTGLTNVTINSDITQVETYAFHGCTKLAELIIPEGATTIGDYAFNGCSSLTNIVIPSTVTNIGYQAFFNCGNITSITLPDNVTTLRTDVFRGCSKLTDINLDNITSIGQRSFDGCGFTNIIIPNSVSYMASEAFQNCVKALNIVINDTLTFIPGFAFYNCTNVTNVVIGSSVTNIGQYAFYYCKNATNVVIGPSVTGIGQYAFAGCSSLQHLIIPNNVKNISNDAFRGTLGLKTIIIGNGVTNIAANAFYNANNVETVYCVPSPDDVDDAATISRVQALLNGTGISASATYQIYNNE